MGPVAVSFQLVIDCTDPERLSRFWAAALSYELEPPPDGFATWDDYWRDVGVPEEDRAQVFRWTELTFGFDETVTPDERANTGAEMFMYADGLCEQRRPPDLVPGGA